MCTVRPKAILNVHSLFADCTFIYRFLNIEVHYSLILVYLRKKGTNCLQYLSSVTPNKDTVDIYYYIQDIFIIYYIQERREKRTSGVQHNPGSCSPGYIFLVELTLTFVVIHGSLLQLKCLNMTFKIVQ